MTMLCPALFVCESLHFFVFFFSVRLHTHHTIGSTQIKVSTASIVALSILSRWFGRLLASKLTCFDEWVCKCMCTSHILVYILIMYLCMFTYTYFWCNFVCVTYKCLDIIKLAHTHTHILNWPHLEIYTMTRYKVKTNNNMENVDLIWTTTEK